MSESSAKVELDALKHFRRALQSFCESVSSALGDGESEIRRVQLWLEGEQSHYWQNEIRKREKVAERCKEALRMKSIFKDATGARQSVVDEEKALKRAQQQMAIALEKVAAVKKYLSRLQKEALLYKGQVQRLSTSVQNDLPTAVHKISAMLVTLEQYAAMAPVDAVSTALTESTSDAMKRSEPTPRPAMDTSTEIETPETFDDDKPTDQEADHGHA